MTRKFDRSKNVLIHQIDNWSYQKSCWARPTPTGPWHQPCRRTVKDEYTSDCLELAGKYSECELEWALIARLLEDI